MKETTRIVTVEITKIFDENLPSADYADQRGFEHELKKWLDADDAHVTAVQDFVMEK